MILQCAVFLRYDNLHDLADCTSLGSTEENCDNEEVGANDGDLLSLSDEYKTEYNLSNETELYQPMNVNPTDSTANADMNILNFSSTGYVSAPVSNPTGNGYVQAPLAKPISSNYMQPSAFIGMRNTVVAKTPIIASTDVEGISGYVTHKQLSDYGHKMQ